MNKLNKGKTMLLEGKTKVKVINDSDDGLVWVDINGSRRTVRRSNLKEVRK